MDSSTILHYAAEASPARLKTFSVSFQGRIFDESAYFREVAERYGTDHHEFDLNPEPIWPARSRRFAYLFRRAQRRCGRSAGLVPVARCPGRHVTVALSGDGADELFGGYKTYLADRYAQRCATFPREFVSFGGTGRPRYLPCLRR